MNRISFGAKNSQEKMQELVAEYNDFKEDTLNQIKVNNLCTNLWHLSDWILIEYFASMSKADFRQDLFRQCDELKIMHDIANANKHFELSRPKARIKESRKHDGVFDRTFDFTFDISRLEIEMEDGLVLDAEKTIDKVFNFWVSYFENI